MLGLETLYAWHSCRHSSESDVFLDEIMNTCYPVDLVPENRLLPKRCQKRSKADGWLVLQEFWKDAYSNGRFKWTRIWRVWIADYPHGWLKNIGWTDWGIVTEENFKDLPWITLQKNAMPSRKMSFRFWWWLRRHGWPMKFERGDPRKSKN